LELVPLRVLLPRCNQHSVAMSYHFDPRVSTAFTSQTITLGGLTYVSDVSCQFPHDPLWQWQRLPSSGNTRRGGGYRNIEHHPPHRSSLNAGCARGRGHIPTSSFASSPASPSLARSCPSSAVPPPAVTRPRIGARRRPRSKGGGSRISEARSPKGEPQQENLGGPRGRGRRCSFLSHHDPGG
jgi:hypothetical protein